MIKTIKQIIGKTTVTDSPIEELVYQELLKYNLNAIPQFKFEHFRIDLAFPEIKLGIELDGKEFNSSEEAIQKDKYRQKKMESKDWKIERFSGSFIYKNSDFIAAMIYLKYFSTKENKELKIKSLGRVTNFFMTNRQHKDIRFSLKIFDSFNAENYI